MVPRKNGGRTLLKIVTPKIPHRIPRAVKTSPDPRNSKPFAGETISKKILAIIMPIPVTLKVKASIKGMKRTVIAHTKNPTSTPNKPAKSPPPMGIRNMAANTNKIILAMELLLGLVVGAGGV